jgi:phosphatidylglycerophosphate synthase
VLLAAAAAVVAGSDLPGRLPLAALIVGISGIADGLDGAVATLTGQSGRRGAVLDAGCDRISDLLFVTALWAAGADGLVCCAAAAGLMVHEYLRAAARGAGLRSVAIITVAERPTRVIVIAAFLLGAGTASWTLDGALASPVLWLNIGAWCALGLSLVALGQLTNWLYRTL